MPWARRMVLRTTASLVVWLVLAASLQAQTITVGPVSTSTKVAWDSSNGSTAAAVQALEARLVVDNAAPVVLTTNKACAASATAGLFSCTATLTAALVTAINKIGSHSIVLKEYDPSTQLESAASVPFVLKSPPAVPTGVRLTP